LDPAPLSLYSTLDGIGPIVNGFAIIRSNFKFQNSRGGRVLGKASKKARFFPPIKAN
jgi:hypothetical protein